MPAKIKLVALITPGTSIRDAAAEMIELAKRLDVALTFEFGGEQLTATGTDTPDDIVRQLDEMSKISEFRTRKFPPRPKPRKKA